MESLQVTNDSSIRAPIEQLPCELVWKLIDYAPGTVFEMRTSSHLLKLRVDEYAFEKLSYPLCKYLEFEQSDRTSLDASLVMPRGHAKLFELRLKLRRTKLANNILSKCVLMFAVYKIRFNLNVYQDYYDKKTAWDYIIECMGSKLGKTSFNNCKDGRMFAIATRLLESTECKKVTIVSDLLTNSAVYALLPMIKDLNVDHVSLYIKRLETHDKPSILKRFAALVRSVRIDQPLVDRVDRNDRYFFDSYNEQWSEIIIELFELKLDTLCIHNIPYNRYLTNEEAKLLIETLPFMDKKVWFSASCSIDMKEKAEHEVNEHFVEVDPKYCRRMTIIHSSREDDSCNF